MTYRDEYNGGLGASGHMDGGGSAFAVPAPERIDVHPDFMDEGHFSPPLFNGASVGNRLALVTEDDWDGFAAALLMSAGARPGDDIGGKRNTALDTRTTADQKTADLT
jgi:hypothetical protein